VTLFEDRINLSKTQTLTCVMAIIYKDLGSAKEPGTRP